MITEKQIEIAVNWWENAMRSPSMQIERTEQDFHNRSQDRAAGMAKIMGALARREVTEEHIAGFKEALRTRLTELSELAHEDASIKLDVDYQPDEVLETALAKAGISGEGWGPILPLKTVMWLFNDGEVQVAEGYGNPFETLT